MATADSISGVTAPSARRSAGLLVLLSSMPPEQLVEIIAKLTVSFAPEDLIIAGSDAFEADNYPALRIVPTAAINTSWMLTAADFVNAYQLAIKTGAQSILMLGPEANTLGASGLCDLAKAVLTGSTDLAVPRYDLPPHARLITSAILYPLVRALFASRVRFPMALDVGLSLRMAECLAGAGHRFNTLNQGDAFLWPVSEATVAGLTINQFGVGPRTLPHATGSDFNTIFPKITGSLFADIDAKAAFWQRFRQLQPAHSFAPMQPAISTNSIAEIAPLLQAFQLAYKNLQEIWQLILPPSSLLGLKRLSATDGAAFRMPERLWARIVFDFLLAHRLRTINRGHLLGALIPLYLAWVASHFNIIASGIDSESHIETVAAAFEADKTYLVSRWRWPDRFNP